jgi:hypothetical protein
VHSEKIDNVSALRLAQRIPESALATQVGLLNAHKGLDAHFRFPYVALRADHGSVRHSLEALARRFERPLRPSKPPGPHPMNSLS